MNEGFQVMDRDTELRAKAAALVAEQDDSALLAQYIAEAKAKREAELRALAAEEARGGEGTGGADAQGFPREYVKLLVYKGQNQNDEQYVKPGINGYVWKIKRGVEVIVPSVVAKVLNNAVHELTTQEGSTIVTQPAHRFPFQVLGQATEPEYRAFMEEQKQMDKPQMVAHA